MPRYSGSDKGSGSGKGPLNTSKVVLAFLIGGLPMAFLVAKFLLKF